MKFLNNLQPKWSRHVTIVHQTKDLQNADYTQLYDFLKYNQKEVDELKAKRLAKTQDPLALMANSNNPYVFPAPHQDQSSFNQNYLQQPMPNPEDIMDPTTAMNMALALMAKAFKLNYSTPTNNNQRISSNLRNRQIAQPRNPAGYNDIIGNQDMQNAVQNPRAKEKGCCLSSDTVIDCLEGRGRNLTLSRRENILITRVYFIEGLGHNLFLIGQFCESDLEVAFKRNACFVRNLEGVDLLKGDRSTKLYTINLHEMASALICLMARASSTKSWLWHQ
nr:integrase, catalytic region, zinc finger, CCHC-type, peptidase aspartic, catalytic [Tanacetum cinerariifolium]